MRKVQRISLTIVDITLPPLLFSGRRCPAVFSQNGNGISLDFFCCRNSIQQENNLIDCRSSNGSEIRLIDISTICIITTSIVLLSRHEFRRGRGAHGHRPGFDISFYIWRIDIESICRTGDQRFTPETRVTGGVIVNHQHQTAMIVGIHSKTKSQLPHVIDTVGCAHFIPRLVKRRQQHGSKNRNDCNNHKEFNQSKCF